MKTNLVILALLSLALCSCGSVDKAGQGDAVKESSARRLTINVLGDSYVKNHRMPYEETWHYKCAMNKGMTYNNYGRNGGCVAFDRTDEGFGPSLLVRYLDMDPNADIVVVIAGHNDAGKIGDDKELLDVFTSSVGELIDKIREHCPHAVIGWVTPWYVDRPGFEPTIQAIKQVCKKKNVPVLDNYKNSCIIKVRDPEFRKRYFQGENDTAHLNADGHDLFVPVGDKFFKTLIDKFIY